MPPPLPQRVLAYIRSRELLRPGDRVGVAVSGGADSVALLHLLHELRAELGLVLSVVHFHHQIRGAAADADQAFVHTLAERLALPFHTAAGNAPTHAKTAGLSLETAARELRYTWFQKLCAGGITDKIATAHTLDDQAETVLMRLVRGAGTRGLAGIYSEVPLLETSATVIRPLLEIRRGEVEAFLHELDQDWREDATNRDVAYARNRVRHVLLPLLEREFNPAIREVLAETAEIARAEESDWNARVEEIWKKIAHTIPSASAEIHLPADAIKILPLALQRRLIRRALASLATPHQSSFQQVEQILNLLSSSGAAEAEVSRGLRVRLVAGCPQKTDPRRDFRTGPEIILRLQQDQPGAVADYEYTLPVPGEVEIRELAIRLRVSPIAGSPAQTQGYNLADLLRPQAVGQELRVRNWHAGDRFWPAHSRAPKKLKELLQSRHVSGPERAWWPVATNAAGELVWLRGFGVAQPFAAPPGEPGCFVLQELSIFTAEDPEETGIKPL